jgi:enoyl-CoA hydratase/carnithine racemase
MGTPTAILEKKDGIAQLRLNRPEALNSLTPVLLDEMEAALDDVIADPSMRALIVSGEGRAFCTGADLKTVISLFDEWPKYVHFVHRISEVFGKVEHCPIPTIAKIHGFALAGGLELLLCCDMAIAADDARIGDQHANFGLIAGGGGIPRLIRRSGRQVGLEILFTGRWLSGVEAADRGIVLRSVPAADLDEATESLAAELRTKSRLGLEYTKRAALAGMDVPLINALNEERSALFEYFSSSDHPRRGIAAFIEKREPNFD